MQPVILFNKQSEKLMRIPASEIATHILNVSNPYQLHMYIYVIIFPE